MACEVHLGGHAPNRDAVEILMNTSACLFVYVDNQKDGIAKASDQLPEKYLAAVAFQWLVKESPKKQWEPTVLNFGKHWSMLLKTTGTTPQTGV